MSVPGPRARGPSPAQNSVVVCSMMVPGTGFPVLAGDGGDGGVAFLENSGPVVLCLGLAGGWGPDLTPRSARHQPDLDQLPACPYLANIDNWNP